MISYFKLFVVLIALGSSHAFADAWPRQVFCEGNFSVVDLATNESEIRRWDQLLTSSESDPDVYVSKPIKIEDVGGEGEVTVTATTKRNREGQVIELSAQHQMMIQGKLVESPFAIEPNTLVDESVVLYFAQFLGQNNSLEISIDSVKALYPQAKKMILYYSYSCKASPTAYQNLAPISEANLKCSLRHENYDNNELPIENIEIPMSLPEITSVSRRGEVDVEIPLKDEFKLGLSLNYDAPYNSWNPNGGIILGSFKLFRRVNDAIELHDSDYVNSNTITFPFELAEKQAGPTKFELYANRIDYRNDSENLSTDNLAKKWNGQYIGSHLTCELVTK